MSIGRRLGSLLALAFYVGSGFAAPLADGLIDHQGGPVSQHHIEGTDGGAQCHNEHCLLDVPVAPQSPTRSPVRMPAGIAERQVAIPTINTSQHLDRTPHWVPRPRAPPRFD